MSAQATIARRPVSKTPTTARRTMTTTDADQVLHVTFSDTALVLYLADGCALSVPLAWYPSLLNAEPMVRGQWKLVAGGAGIYWPGIGQHLTVAGILKGNGAVE